MQVVGPGQPGESWDAGTDARTNLPWPATGRLCDPVSSNRSLSIEVFAWLRRSWITLDPFSVSWINVEFVVAPEFYFD
jgi:hypothetical protein